ncbi:hypothetical protein [Stieleria varia]|uniref:Uncharacterized protein n=1 Tax=Stieleria varia TaxID=2528005 RepID=A0A5C6B7B7_9BACT|nr:hypothetical protein [Stieleria varia]TWU07820.1 hypothetical protein Pla52n_03950 [Stieleria varia]
MTRPAEPSTKPSRPDRPGTLPGEGIGNRPNPDRPGKPDRPPAYRPPNWRPPAYQPVWHPWYRPGNGQWNWWRPVTYVALSQWLPYRWSTPVTYSYGSGGTVQYVGDTITINNDQSVTTQQYFEQVDTRASNVPEIAEDQADDLEWLRLGGFSIIQDDVSDSTMMIQLAVTKTGVIAGTLFNEVTGVPHPLEAMVDAETQRAAWRSAEGTNEDVVMETGIFNFSEEETPVLIHFGPDSRQTWKLIRLEDPEGDASSNAAEPGSAPDR